MEAEFAVQAMLCLAQDYGQGLRTLAEICRKRRLNKYYLAKICRKLVQADLLDAKRARSGGYKLARPPDQITLLEVIEAIEGSLALNLCQHDPPKCPDTDCPVRPVWEDLQGKVRSVLGAKTLGELVCPREGPAGPPR